MSKLLSKKINSCVITYILFIVIGLVLTLVSIFKPTNEDNKQEKNTRDILFLVGISVLSCGIGLFFGSVVFRKVK